MHTHAIKCLKAKYLKIYLSEKDLHFVLKLQQNFQHRFKNYRNSR